VSEAPFQLAHAPAGKDEEGDEDEHPPAHADAVSVGSVSSPWLPALIQASRPGVNSA